MQRQRTRVMATTAPRPVDVQCDAYYGALGSVVPANHLPPPTGLTRTNREQIARFYQGTGTGIVKGPLAYDTEKQLERGFGVRSDTNVVGYIYAPKAFVTTSTAPEMLGGVGCVRRTPASLPHGGSFGANPIPARMAMPGSSDNTKNRLPVDNPWMSQMGFIGHQLAANPYHISINHGRAP